MRRLVADPLSALASPEVLQDPYPAYAWLQANTPVFFYPRFDSWILTRYADCAAVLHDSTRFASDWRRVGEQMPTPLLSIQTLDPPEHTAIRRLLLDAVRAQDLRALQKIIAEKARTLMAALVQRDTFDCVTGLAEPLALGTISAFLGVEPPDAKWFLPVSHRIVDGMDATMWPELGPPAVAARAELAGYAQTWLDARPSGGIVGYVLADDRGVDRSVLLNSLRVVLHAGFESASRLLGNAAAALLGLPATERTVSRAAAGGNGLAAFLAADPATAVDELVRYDPPVQGDARACVSDTELGGVTIKTGQAVTLLLGAANHDPERFADPAELRLDRTPNPHLGFGRGSHACLGPALAVLQARVLFTVLATEYPAIRLAGPPVHRRNLTLRGLDRLELTAC